MTVHIHLVLLTQDETLRSTIADATKLDIHYEIQTLPSYVRQVILILLDADTVDISIETLESWAAKSYIIVSLTNELASLPPDTHNFFHDIWFKPHIHTMAKKRLANLIQRIRLDHTIESYVAMLRTELLNPIVAIRGYGEMLLESETFEIGHLSDKQREYMTTILISTERMRTQIDDLSKWVLIQRDTFTLQLENTPLMQIFDDLQGRYDFELTTPEKDLVVWADGSYLSLVIKRILDAATQFRLYKRDISITCIQTDSFVQVSIRSDLRIVIIYDDTLTNFRLFVVPSTELLQHIITLHNGKFWAEDENTVHFTLPLAEQSDEQ